MVNSVKPYSLRDLVRIRALVSFFRARYRPDASSSSRRDISTHRAAILLRHADHRLQSVRPDSVVRWSILLNRILYEIRSELEHWSASLEPDIVLMLLVHHGGISAHIVRLFSFVTLTQVNLFRLRCSGIVSGFVLALTTLSFRDIIVVSSLAQERRRSHIRRGNSYPLLVLLLTAFPSLLLEKEKGNGTCLKKKHISLRSFNMTNV